MIVNNELEGMREEAVVAYFHTLWWNLSEGTEENDEKLRIVGVSTEIWANVFSVPVVDWFRQEHVLSFLVRTREYVASPCLLHKPAKNINFEVSLSPFLTDMPPREKCSFEVY